MQAQDVMTTMVATIAPEATVQQAAKLMLDRRVSALPVVDGKGRVIGMVSEGDLVRRPAGVSRNSGTVSWFGSQRLRPMQQVCPVMLAPALSAAATITFQVTIN